MTSPTKPEVHIATPLEDDRAMATGNKQKIFGEVRLCGFRDMRVDRRTSGQTDILITILFTPIGRGKKNTALLFLE